MGDKQNAEMTLFYAKDGQWEKIENVKEFPEFHSENVKTTTLDINPVYFETPWTAEFKLPKSWRCKSRKRFIKLLMSKGMWRDCAVWNADMVQKSGLSYSDAWFRFMICGGV